MLNLKLILISCSLCFYCSNNAIAQSELLNTAVKNVTNAIVHDVFSAPAASRIYAYATIAAFETIRVGDTNYQSFYGRLNQFPELPLPENNSQINFPLAGVYALYYTSKYMLFSEETIQLYIMELRNKYTVIVSEQVNKDSEHYGLVIAEKIIAWAATDGYKESRTLPRYTFLEQESAFQPTLPDYADAVEPYWGNLRTFALDSATQFKPQPCEPFSTDSNSLFFKNALEVYETGKNLTEEQKMIVLFWDDNPLTTIYIGHMQYAEKKMSPAGHWLDIARVAIELTKTDEVRAAQIYATVSIANADAFISCWAEKYNSNVIRPESYIRRYIDTQWKPFLQTPAFPEYTSGHSTISAASATILTYYFGTNFVFTDSSETVYDLPPRSYGSFVRAANEASISRFYGGIHYKKSTEAGTSHGFEIGVYLLYKLKKG